MNILKRISGIFKHRRECDHIYFPVVAAGHLLGQRCAICGKFNDLEQVLGPEAAAKQREADAKFNSLGAAKKVAERGRWSI